MKPINDNLTIQRLGGWTLTELQKSLGLANTMRANIDPDNHRLWLRSGDVLKVLINGDSDGHRVQPQIEIIFDWERESASVWVDHVSSLVRGERQHDFNPEDLPNPPDPINGEIEVNVALGDAIERIEIWKLLPPNPKPDGPAGGHLPNVIGMMRK